MDPLCRFLLYYTYLPYFVILLVLLLDAAALPRLLNFQVERMVRRNLEAEIQTLQEELRRQKDSLESAVAQLESLRAMQSTKDMVCDTSSA